MRFSSESKGRAVVFALFGGVLVSSASSAFAQSTAPAPTVRSETIDLNGDGTQEKIAVSGTVTSPLRLVLSINGVKLTEKEFSDTDEVPGFRIVQIDGNTKARQIVVEFIQLNGTAKAYFYRWDGKSIRRIGVIEDPDKITGNGAVYGNIYMGFWSCKQKYALNPKTQTFDYVRQPMYSVGIPATVKQSFPLLLDHTDGSSTVAKTAPGSKIQLVMFWSPAVNPGDSTPTNSWFLIKTATGLSGWTRLETFEKKVDGLIYGG